MKKYTEILNEQIKFIGGTSQTAKKSALKILYNFARKEGLNPAILNEIYLEIAGETYSIGLKNNKLVFK